MRAPTLARVGLIRVRSRVQDVDRVPHVKARAEPSGCGRVGVDCEAVRLVLCSDEFRSLTRNLGRRRNVWQDRAVRAAELKLAVRQTLEPVSLFMDGAVVASA
jgi:hypothetical protein